jgi:hypothetical protein
MPCSSAMTSQNLAPIWLPHWPPWIWTISRTGRGQDRPERERERDTCGVKKPTTRTPTTTKSQTEGQTRRKHTKRVYTGCEHMCASGEGTRGGGGRRGADIVRHVLVRGGWLSCENGRLRFQKSGLRSRMGRSTSSAADFEKRLAPTVITVVPGSLPHQGDFLLLVTPPLLTLLKHPHHPSQYVSVQVPRVSGVFCVRTACCRLQRFLD